MALCAQRPSRSHTKLLFCHPCAAASTERCARQTEAAQRSAFYLFRVLCRLSGLAAFRRGCSSRRRRRHRPTERTRAPGNTSRALINRILSTTVHGLINMLIQVIALEVGACRARRLTERARRTDRRTAALAGPRACWSSSSPMRDEMTASSLTCSREGHASACGRQPCTLPVAHSKQTTHARCSSAMSRRAAATHRSVQLAQRGVLRRSLFVQNDVAES